ncbi:hypothetical protein PQZ39_00030 [bacterium]|nr:hypothetical protein [bacterium]
MLNTPDHPYSNHANSTLEWEFLGIDTEENFNNRLKKENHPDLIYYQKNPIEYRLNNYGFRSDDDFFEGDEGNIFLGCSHTFGTGHYIENVWSYLVNKAVGGKFLNLGVAGSSIATGFRMLNYWLDKFEVKNIFIYYPHKYRYEFYNGVHFTYWPIFNFPKFSKQIQLLHLEEVQAEDHYLSKLYAIYYLAEKKKIPTHVVFEENIIRREPNPNAKVLLARDTHLNTGQHYALYKEMLGMYNKNQKLI